MADVTLTQVRKSYGAIAVIHGIDLHIKSCLLYTSRCV